MGVTWSAEIMSYFLSRSMAEIFYITDFLNLIQGFLIFAVFVLKAKVKTLVIRRLVQCIAFSFRIKDNVPVVFGKVK